MKKVVVVLGPTAIGKTAIGIALAKHFNGEIISGDSIAIYKGLNIGSAKPSKEERSGVEHHLIDILDPIMSYSCFDFQQQARGLIDKIEFPFIVGGTGLYIKSVICNYEFIAKRDDAFEDHYKDYTNKELFDELCRLDPITAANTHLNNRKRVLRGLFGVHNNDMMSNKVSRNEKIYDYYIVYLDANREELYNRINDRVDLMFTTGLVEEVSNLAKNNIFPLAIGYKEFRGYFRGEVTLDWVREEIKKNSRHLAKKQVTWFKNQMDTHFYDVDFNNIDHTVEEIISDLVDFFRGV